MLLICAVVLVAIHTHPIRYFISIPIPSGSDARVWIREGDDAMRKRWEGLAVILGIALVALALFTWRGARRKNNDE